jgi:hypothetical protein
MSKCGLDPDFALGLVIKNNLLTTYNLYVHNHRRHDIALSDANL